MKNKKVEIMYFYSAEYENRQGLSKWRKKLRKKSKDVLIRLVNVEDPKNGELTELYKVNTVPVMVFLNPRGEIAARKSIPLSEEKLIQEITERINKGELPNSSFEEVRTRIIEAIYPITKRNDLINLMVEQVENDLMEANPESMIYESINRHISTINHTVKDLLEFKRILQKFAKNQHNFIV
jgi:hypothetical protein